MEHCLGELADVIAAGRYPGRLPCGLHGREKQARERADDRDDDQEFDEGEGAGTTNTMRFDDIPLDKITINKRLDERKRPHDHAV
jgi:hypothetical protein